MTDTRPEFAVALRGYDRTQVEAYVARLHQRLAETQRAPAPADPDDVVTGELPAVEAQPRDDDFDRLGARISTILRLAEEEAAERRDRGAAEAEELVTRARR